MEIRDLPKFFEMLQKNHEKGAQRTFARFYNLKYVKNTHGVVVLLSTESNTYPGIFHGF